MGCSSSNTGQSVTISSKPARVVMIGLDRAGKTQILYWMTIKERISTIPTVGFNTETIPGPRGFQLALFDVGGAEKLRPLWKQHYGNCEAVVFVVDSADVERLKEAKDALFGELGNRDLRGVPLLVLANKTDIREALTPSDVQQQLHLKAIIDRTWALDPVCGFTGEGLDVALADLARLINENRMRNDSVRIKSNNANGFN